MVKMDVALLSLQYLGLYKEPTFVQYVAMKHRRSRWDRKTDQHHATIRLPMNMCHNHLLPITMHAAGFYLCSRVVVFNLFRPSGSLDGLGWITNSQLNQYYNQGCQVRQGMATSGSTKRGHRGQLAVMPLLGKTWK